MKPTTPPAGAEGGGHTQDFRQKTIPDRQEFDTLNDSGSREIDIGRILHLGTRSTQSISHYGDLDKIIGSRVGN